jgi:hypothetical protein
MDQFLTEQQLKDKKNLQTLGFIPALFIQYSRGKKQQILAGLIKTRDSIIKTKKGIFYLERYKIFSPELKDPYKRLLIVRLYPTPQHLRVQQHHPRRIDFLIPAVRLRAHHPLKHIYQYKDQILNVPTIPNHNR